MPTSIPSVLTADIIRQVLESDAPYQDEDERVQCKAMVESLTPSDVEGAARTSYAYYVASTSSDESLNKLATDEHRTKAAARMARRHLVQKLGDREEALRIMKEAIAFRQERKIDSLRMCYTVKSEDDSCASLLIRDDEVPDSSLLEKYRSLVRKDLKTQPMVVRGHDVSDRAILVKFPRLYAETDEEAYVLAQLYLAERAIAATEILSVGREEKILLVFDFADYQSHAKPPLAAMRRLVPLLQTNYPERLDHLIIVEPGFWMRTLFTLLSPFIDPHTREKVVMVNGEEQRLNKLRPLVSSDQAMPFMLPDGALESDVDIDHFLNNVPFFSLYDVKA